VGDLVVSPLNTISYSLNGTVLTRTIDGTAEPLADAIQDLQFRYVLDNGTTVDDPSATGDLGNIRLVQVTITAQTLRESSKDGIGNALSRQLTELVRVKNLEVQSAL
jgi:hypothetical protein